jgi:large subunit ribosomal protein L27e
VQASLLAYCGTMVKFLKANKVVVLLQGRYAGRKAVIVKNFDDGTKERPYGHAIVCGIAKYPRKVIKKASQKTIAKRSRLKAFTKVVNYNHIMPTRYTLDVDLKSTVTAEKLESTASRVEARKGAKAVLEERFKTGKNRWFFSKLRF